MDVKLDKTYKYFLEPKRLQALNKIVALHERLTPRTIQAATGSSFYQASSVLTLLYVVGLAEIYLLVYVKGKDDTYVERRALSEGFPKLPVKYDEIRIESDSQLYYDFEFDLSMHEHINFVVSNG